MSQKATNEREIARRFASKFEVVGDCWIWTSHRNQDGYGSFHFKGRCEKAHRASYEMENGSIKYGEEICHKCDTPSCVKPDHLFAGSRSVNQSDSAKKMRQACQKLTMSQVLEIRRELALGARPRDLGPKYGVAPQHISKIKHRRWWAHI